MVIAMVVAGDGDQRDAKALNGPEQLQNLFRFATRGEGDHNITLHQHSQISVQSFNRMHEQ